MSSCYNRVKLCGDIRIGCKVASQKKEVGIKMKQFTFTWNTKLRPIKFEITTFLLVVKLFLDK